MIVNRSILYFHNAYIFCLRFYNSPSMRHSSDIRIDSVSYKYDHLSSWSCIPLEDSSQPTTRQEREVSQVQLRIDFILPVTPFNSKHNVPLQTTTKRCYAVLPAAQTPSASQETKLPGQPRGNSCAQVTLAGMEDEIPC